MMAQVFWMTCSITVIEFSPQFYASSNSQGRLSNKKIEIKEIIQHGPSNPVFEHATLQSQVQRSID